MRKMITLFIDRMESAYFDYINYSGFTMHYMGSPERNYARKDKNWRKVQKADQILLPS